MSLTFEHVLDDSLLLFLENWAAFAAWIDKETGGGSGQVKLDLTMRQITFLPRLVKRNEVVVPVHLMATVLARGEVQWAWANPEFAEKPVSQLSTRVRDFGQQQQIATFADPSHAVPGGDEQLRAAHPIALAATCCRITGMPVAHLMPVKDQQVVLALDPAGFLPPVPTRDGLVDLLQNSQATGLVQDGRRAVQGYAQARGLGYQWGEGFGHLDLQLPEGSVRVTFDEQGTPSVEG